MSVSVDEKLRIAHALDDLGVHFVEAGFPASNPKEEAVFDLLSRETLRAQRDRRLRDDPPPRLRGRRRPRPAHPGRLLRAGVHAGGQDLEPAPGEGHPGRPRGEPAHDRRLGRVPARPGQAGDLRRRALLRRLPRRRRLRAALPARGLGGRRGEPHPVRHQRLVAARPGGRGHGGSADRAARSSARHPHPRRRRLRGGQLAGGGRGRGHAGPGHGQRLRRALRQREPDDDRARPPAEDGRRRARARAPGAADRGGPPRRRAVQRHPRPRPALRGPERLRPQGRDARGGGDPRRPHLRARRPGRGGGRPPGADLRAGRQGLGARPCGRGRPDRQRA